jgi:hypothetical protein
VGVRGESSILIELRETAFAFSVTRLCNCKEAILVRYAELNSDEGGEVGWWVYVASEGNLSNVCLASKILLTVLYVCDSV